jgi:hypothetical protein
MRCYPGLSHVETATARLTFFDASARRCPMEQPAEDRQETFNPWSIVNLVFHHLADQGLHPILGDAGDPGAPAAQLLRCLGIEPAAEGNLEISRDVRDHLAEIRTAMFGDGTDTG